MHGWAGRGHSGEEGCGIGDSTTGSPGMPRQGVLRRLHGVVLRRGSAAMPRRAAGCSASDGRSREDDNGRSPSWVCFFFFFSSLWGR